VCSFSGGRNHLALKPPLRCSFARDEHAVSHMKRRRHFGPQLVERRNTETVARAELRNRVGIEISVANCLAAYNFRALFHGELTPFCVDIDSRILGESAVATAKVIAK
jgi:hypothetical protein